MGTSKKETLWKANIIMKIVHEETNTGVTLVLLLDMHLFASCILSIVKTKIKKIIRYNYIISDIY